MREFKMDTKIIHMPDVEMRTEPKLTDGHHCSCHVRMGNDFYFLPMGSCLRPSGQCDNIKGQRLDA